MRVGFLMWCGDLECDCWVPVINEVRDGQAKEIWRGTFLEKPSEIQKEELREELRRECERQGECQIIADVTYGRESVDSQ